MKTIVVFVAFAVLVQNPHFRYYDDDDDDDGDDGVSDDWLVRCSLQLVLMNLLALAVVAVVVAVVHCPRHLMNVDQSIVFNNEYLFDTTIDSTYSGTACAGSAPTFVTSVV